MIRAALIILLFFPVNFLQAQINLVLNGDFETYSQCPTGNSFITYANGWFQPNLCLGGLNGSTDYLNTCSTNPSTSPPLTIGGFQYSRSGNGHGGFSPFSLNNNLLEYIEGTLIQALDSGKTYYIEYYLTAGNDGYAIDKVELYFSVDTLSVCDFFAYHIAVSPQITNNIIISDTLNWTRISGFYTAQGGENFFTVGNFHDTSNINYVRTDSLSPTIRAYYFIDDVYVGEYISETDLNFVLYPNPSSGNFTLDYRLGDYTDAVFRLYNDIGQLVYQRDLSEQIATVYFDFTILANGVYFWQVTNGRNKLKTDKLVVLH